MSQQDEICSTAHSYRSGGAANHTGHITIRLSAEAEEFEGSDLRELSEALGWTALHGFLSENNDLIANRAIQGTPVSRLRALEKRSLGSDFPYVHSVTRYWHLNATAYDDPEALRQELGAMQGVELAYHAARISPAWRDCGKAGNYLCMQGYLNPAPCGIDAHYAWTQQGGRGQNANLIDLESGWNLGHDDLPTVGLLFGDNAGALGYSDLAEHGTRTLGVIGAVDNGFGITGIAPQLASLNVVSHFNSQAAPTQGDPYYQFLHVADAIIAASLHLSAGDILVLEVQRHPYGFIACPTEIDPLDADSILLASSLGIIVVEAAGNGWDDLANWQDANGKHTFDKGKPGDFLDSGAIIVGACRSNEAGNSEIKISSWSNYGSRVDCYAWGQNVCSTSGSVGENDSYDSDFGKTSAATAIIGGACALVQSWHKHPLVHNSIMTPLELREKMSRWDNGTSIISNYSPFERIGVMPDLRKIMS